MHNNQAPVRDPRWFRCFVFETSEYTAHSDEALHYQLYTTLDRRFRMLENLFHRTGEKTRRIMLWIRNFITLNRFTLSVVRSGYTRATVPCEVVCSQSLQDQIIMGSRTTMCDNIGILKKFAFHGQENVIFVKTYRQNQAVMKVAPECTMCVLFK